MCSGLCALHTCVSSGLFSNCKWKEQWAQESYSLRASCISLFTFYCLKFTMQHNFVQRTFQQQDREGKPTKFLSVFAHIYITLPLLSFSENMCNNLTLTEMLIQIMNMVIILTMNKIYLKICLNNPLYPCHSTPFTWCYFPPLHYFCWSQCFICWSRCLLFQSQIGTPNALLFVGPGGFPSTLAAPHVPDALLLTILTRGPTSTPQCHTHSPPLHSHSNTTPSFWCAFTFFARFKWLINRLIKLPMQVNSVFGNTRGQPPPHPQCYTHPPPPLYPHPYTQLPQYPTLDTYFACLWFLKFAIHLDYM